MNTVRVVLFFAFCNLICSIFGFIKTGNYWYIPPMIIMSIFTLGCIIYHRRREIIQYGNGFHACQSKSSNAVCLEVDGDLWIKEYYAGKDNPEGRTYMVYYCPWCGYQTEKSKIREKVDPILKWK